jgi:hypothetical protein
MSSIAPYLAGAPEPFPGDTTVDLRDILKEVKQGCRSHEKKLSEAQELQNWYDGDSERYVPLRSSEDAISWLARPKRVSYITRQAVNKLCSHLYKPGPRHRRVGNGLEDVDAWYGRVCQDLHLNSLFQHADKLATLHGLCAIGIYSTGNFRRPINFHLFPRQDFTYWSNPDDPRVPTALCTITRTRGDTTRYRVWTSTHYYTFYKQRDWGVTAGSMTVARYDVKASGEHGYGVLPFAMITHELPTTDLETCGLGYLLKKINYALNVDKSNLAHWVHHYARPLGFITGVPPDWQPKFSVGGFVPLVVRHDNTELPGVVPEARYLESSFDVQAVREWIASEANQSLAELGIPITLGTLLSGDRAAGHTPSGLAIAANDADLITYSKGRQPLFGVHETSLFALICQVGGSPRGNMGSLSSRLLAAAYDPSLRVAWPEPSIDLPGHDRDLADGWELNAGITDPIEILMRRQGLTEEEGIAQYTSVQRRRALAVKISADVVANPVDPAIDPDPTPDLTMYDDPDRTDDGSVAPDMGIESSGEPSPYAQPEDSVNPSITATVVVTPRTPIASADVLGAVIAGSGMGSEG